MPTYEYRREDGSIFEYRQGINDEPLTTCPDTGQKVIRMISGGGGVVYKGDGWYVTDYKNGGNGSGSAANGSGSKSASADGGESASGGKDSGDGSEGESASADTGT